MKKDPTNPKSRSKKNQGDIEAVNVSNEQDTRDESMQAQFKAPVREDVEQNDHPENTTAEDLKQVLSQKSDEDQLSIPDILPVLPSGIQLSILLPFNRSA